MNIVQIHDQVRYMIDEFGSPRIEPAEIDAQLWASSKALVKQKFDHASEYHKEDTFERNQRLMDELANLVMISGRTGAGVIGVSQNFIAAASLPARYGILLLMELTYGNASDPDADSPWVYADPLSNNRKKDWLTRNPYRRPKTGMFENNYYQEYNAGFLIHSSRVNIDHCALTYLALPNENYYGDIRTSGFTATGDTPAIAIDDTTHGGIAYKSGDEFTISNGATLTNGSVVTGFINVDLPSILHLEVAEMATFEILKSKNLFDKAAAFEKGMLMK